jgi:hypothetical protein
LQNIREPFLEAVKITLGDRYTENMESIYKVAITFILQTMTDGIDDALKNKANSNSNNPNANSNANATTTTPGTSPFPPADANANRNTVEEKL